MPAYQQAGVAQSAKRLMYRPEACFITSFLQHSSIKNANPSPIHLKIMFGF
jgi:hypothetical protein